MGLGVTNLIEEDDGGGGKEVAVSCSICLDAVTDNGDRSWAKLQCGHKFHLDCIGSAFNVKGAMQCPNCRKIEKGQWLYANGSRPGPEFMEEWTHEDDLLDISYSEMSVGVHWCPFPSNYDEGEFQSNSFHDLFGHNSFFTEHTPVSSTSHPCPYVAYIGPMPPSASSGSVSDGSSFNSHWRGQAVTHGGPSSYLLPTMDATYNDWYTATSRMSGADQPSLSQRTARSNPEIQRHAMHPYLYGHGSASRAPSSITSTMPPPFANTQPRPRDRTQFLPANFHQSASNPLNRAPLMSARRSRNTGTVTPVPPPLDQSGGIYFVSSSSSGRTYQEPEIPLRDRFQSWDREHQPPYPMSQVDRDSSIWGPFHPPASGSDAAMRSGTFRPRHGSSQNRS